jgi:hypothetical protein
VTVTGDRAAPVALRDATVILCIAPGMGDDYDAWVEQPAA